MNDINFIREFNMPNSETFSLPSVAKLLRRWISENDLMIVDPFARNSKFANISNDLNPATSALWHLPAEQFLQEMKTADMVADVVLLDPPYSPRQISEVYQQIGLECGTKDTQNARLYKVCKDGLDHILKPQGIAICCGWNSMGFGLKRGYEMLEILLVTHGAAHNDTIVTVERKL